MPAPATTARRKGLPREPEATPPGELPPGLRPDPASQFGIALGHVLTDVLPRLISRSLLAALREDGHVCARCALARCRWEREHAADLQGAWERACDAAGLMRDDPAAQALDMTPYLPPDLAPGMPDGLPPSYPAVTVIGGWELCAVHVAEQEAAQARREAQEESARLAALEAAAGGPPQSEPARPLLVTPPGMSASAAAREASRNVPGLPGYAEPASR